ncbi:MAG: Tfp pilus assembly protein FimT [Verrucomicrobia bacterium]|nr:MAG: Tfp pilus assembly protein FimT [Verrucomicrobiota bacterium]
MREQAPFPLPKRRPTLVPKPQGKRGFTLVEIVVVLGIILMILGFAAPAVVGMLRGKKVEQALAVVSDVLERTRMEAVTQNTYLWAGFSNVPMSETPSGQDELWILSFRGKTGEARIPADPASILPAGALRRVEGITLVPNTSLPERLASLFPQGAKDFILEPPSIKPLNWAGAGASGARLFDKLILFTPRGEALLETGSNDTPVPDAYLWLGLSRTINKQVAQNEKDAAAVSISGLTGRVLSVRP